MIAIFLGILVLLAIWGTFILGSTGALGFAFGLPAALFFTFLVVVTVGGVFVLRKLKAKAASKELDKTLNAQADEQERNARPDLQPQVQEMRAEFQKAVGSLKSSRLGRSGADALSVLPWYVIIGPSGTGKTTALKNSGLKFPYLGKKKGGVRGVGGTRNCDWWLTNEGVILDTAGRYMTEEDDQEEWLSFLDSVAKARPKRPINGLIVTVSASDLLNEDEAGAAALGAQLRERVDEVTGRLHLLVPVYLLVTKCDLLSGFAETFGSLPKSERGQVWGFTFPVGTTHEDGPGELVREHLDELTDVLFERTGARLSQERKMETREKIFRFPRQLQLLRAGLGEISQALFTENPYQDTPILRGVYFTSGTQEGRPIDKVMSAMAESFGLRASLPQGDAPTDARSYFLGGLFTDVIFKDVKLATRSSKAVQLQRRQRFLYAGAAVAASLLLVVWPLLAWSGMRAQAAQMLVKVQDVTKADSTGDRLRRLEALRAALVELREQGDSTVRGIWSFGMNRRAELATAIEPVYGQWVRDLVVMDTLHRDAEALEHLPEPEVPGAPPPPTPRRMTRAQRAAQAAAASAKPKPLDEEAAYEALKRHMLLSLHSDEPPLRDPELLQRELQSLVEPMAADFWKNTGEGTEEELEQNLELLFKLWPRYRKHWQVERRDDLKRKGQESLRYMDRTRRLLAQLVRRWAKDAQDLNVAALTGDAGAFESSKKVRAAFTEAVWSKAAKEGLENPPPDDEAWILNTKPEAGAEVKRKLKSAYYSQYIREWTEMLLSIELQPVSSPEQVRRRLEALNVSGKSPPLQKLWEQINTNLVLGIPPLSKPDEVDEQAVTWEFWNLAQVKPDTTGLLAKKLSSAVQKMGQKVGSKVGMAPSRPGQGRALELARYEGKLNDFAKAVDEAKDPSSQAQVAKVWRSEAEDLDSLIGDPRFGPPYDTVMRQLLVKPLRVMANTLDAETRAGLNSKWCASVYALHSAELRGRYPFVKTSRQDANLEALAELYNAKGGKLWEFYNQALDNVKVRDHGDEYKRVGGEPVTDPLLAYLNRAKTFRDAVFPSEAAEPRVDFTVQIHLPKGQGLNNIQGVNFFLDDQQARQDSGPLEAPASMHWPGKAPRKAYLSVKVTGARPKVIGCYGEQECTGDFAFFRLLEQGRLTPRGPRSFTMSWPADLGTGTPVEVSIDFAWSRSVSPFYGREGARAQPLLAVFRSLEPPPAIVPGVEICR